MNNALESKFISSEYCYVDSFKGRTANFVESDVSVLRVIYTSLHPTWGGLMQSK